MGLRASIYKDQGRSFSNGGISEMHNEVTIVNADGPFEPTEKCPAVAIVHGNLAGTVKIVPVKMLSDDDKTYLREHLGREPLSFQPISPPDKLGPMAGGCYVATSDSRFSETIELLLGRPFYGAVPLHDRFETPAQYRELSAD